MEIQSYLIIYALYMVAMIVVSIRVYKVRKKIDEMHGMMIGMTFGMVSGLVTATIFLIPTGNFLYGVIIGSIVGLLFGVPFGKLGGHLGIMEGTIAGPMGGMMGAMLGQMVRPFDIEVFIPFLTSIFLITMIGITYAVNCRVKCCSPNKISKTKNEISNQLVLIGSLAAILLVVSIALPFSIESVSGKALVSSVSVTQDYITPSYLQNTKEEVKEATLKDGYQEAEIRITVASYSPNVIVAKKGIPLKMNLRADETAGCAREIVFPDFGISKIVGPDKMETIEINPTQAGEFRFRCSMDMVRGKLIVTE